MPKTAGKRQKEEAAIHVKTDAIRDRNKNRFRMGFISADFNVIFGKQAGGGWPGKLCLFNLV
jgi:hypothetical protein